jgi:polyisoprenoid-binding protein YceI
LSRSAKAPIVAIFALASLAAFVGQCSAGIYSFDNKHANVNFTYYVGFASQSGRFTDMNGVFQFDRRAPAQGSIKAVIKTASLTANAFESELRGSRFFNVGVFPEIRFASRSVKPAGEDRAEFNGDLTMNGVTRPVTLQVVFQPEARAGLGSAQAASSPDSRARMIATTRLKRSEFNMTSLTYLVNDEIDIEISAALQEKK